ncbi:hypothetical protein [Streptomyces sp. NPDC017890]|uniref:hypothetical protein n=1 Tax=Streptomyces sp. NPDC017890 TaxID=3365015 RepID=UPI0037939803
MDHSRHTIYSSTDFEDGCPRCCLDALVERSREAEGIGLAMGLEGLVDKHARVVERHVLRLAGESELFARLPYRRRSSSLVDWAAHLRHPERFATTLPVLTAVIVGDARARDELSRFDRGARTVLEKFQRHTNSAEAELWYLVALLMSERSTVATAGLRADVQELASRRPRAWAASLDWLFAVGDQLNDLDVIVTLSLAETRPCVKAALKRSTRSEIPSVRKRAAGITALARGSSPIEEKLLNALSQSVDARRHVFPRPLEHPSSTWLSSCELEDLIRGGVSAAVRDFTAFVARAGAQDEEPLTATLLRMLEEHLSTTSTAGRRLTPGTPEVVLASRQETKHAEQRNGADVGIILEITAPGRMAARVGDLVQVKKAQALIPSAPPRDSWKIESPQLTTLLDQSATAAYWLIAGSGEIRVVPAKFLAAHEAGKAGGRGSFVVGHSEIRHSAIGLEHYLTDLITGLWLGSSGSALTAADGHDPRNRPTFFLRVNVTLPLLDDQYGGTPFTG